MLRLLTALVAVPLALAAVFYLPSLWFFVFILLVFECGAVELVRLARRWAPDGPLAALALLVPPAAVLLSPELIWGTIEPLDWRHMMAAGMALSLVLGSLVLLCRTPVEQAVLTLGILGFGIPYLAIPVASLFHLRRLDPWVLVLLLAIVWLGDTAAYYVGKRFGRHRLAPVVSPNKSWEGAVAGVAAGFLATLAWSLLRLGWVGWPLLAVGVATAIGGQLGDLVESMLKRAAGVKDTGAVFPGHGGVLDRVDALMFAAPMLVAGLWIVGYEAVLP